MIYHIGVRASGLTTLSSITLHQSCTNQPPSTSALIIHTLHLYLQSGGSSFPPLGVLYALREKFPQFAQQGAGGAYMQQDAEECWTNLLYALREKLKVRQT